MLDEESVIVQRRRVRSGAYLSILGGCLWGFSGVCGNFLLNQRGVTASWLVSVRLIIAGLILITFSLANPRTREKTTAIWKDRHDVFVLLIYGIFGMASCQFTYFMAVGLSDAGTATSIQYTSPAMVMVLTSIRDRALPKRIEVVALIMVISGVFLIATGGSLSGLTISGAALLWAIISAFTIVIYNMIPVNLMQKYGSVPVVAWGMVIAGIIMIFLAHPWEVPGTWDTMAVLALLSVAIFGTVLSFTLYMEGVNRAGAKLACIFAASEPLTATILTAVLMKVPLTVGSVVGLILIITAVTALQQYEGRK